MAAKDGVREPNGRSLSLAGGRPLWHVEPCRAFDHPAPAIGGDTVPGRSTLAHIGRLKACFKAIHADTPEEARAIRAGLDKIRLPPRYQYPGRSRRS